MERFQKEREATLAQHMEMLESRCKKAKRGQELETLMKRENQRKRMHDAH